MDIFLYNNLSSNEHLDKNLTDVLALSGTLRTSTSVTRPVFTVTNKNVVDKNYCYIPDFNRYYYITDITSANNNSWIISCEVDVLMSYKDSIKKLNVVIDRQEIDNIDKYIHDNPNVVNTKHFNEVFEFANGFSDTPYYILITAGSKKEV